MGELTGAHLGPHGRRTPPMSALSAKYAGRDLHTIGQRNVLPMKRKKGDNALTAICGSNYASVALPSVLLIF